MFTTLTTLSEQLASEIHLKQSTESGEAGICLEVGRDSRVAQAARCVRGCLDGFKKAQMVQRESERKITVDQL